MSGQFNGLKCGEHERLALLMEEMGEAIHVIGKILRHGYESRHPNGGPTNREMLERELGHVGFAKDLMIREDDILGENVQASRMEKFLNVGKYLHHNQVGGRGQI